jgi:hypothetical protein
VKWHEIKRQRLKPNKDMIEAQQRPHFQELQQLSADLLNTAQRTHGIVQKLRQKGDESSVLSKCKLNNNPAGHRQSFAEEVRPCVDTPASVATQLLNDIREAQNLGVLSSTTDVARVMQAVEKIAEELFALGDETFDDLTYGMPLLDRRSGLTP